MAQSPIQQLIQSLAGVQSAVPSSASNAANNGNPNTVYNTSQWGYGGPPVMDSNGSWSTNQFSPAATLQGLNLNLGSWSAPQGSGLNFSNLMPVLPNGGIVTNPNWPTPPPTTPPVVTPPANPDPPPVTGGNGGGGTVVGGGGGGTGTIVRPENPGTGLSGGWGGIVGTGGNSNTGTVSVGDVTDIGVGGGNPLTPEQLEAGYGGSITKDPNSPLNPGTKPGDNTKSPTVLDSSIFNPNSGSLLSRIANSQFGSTIGMNPDGSMRWEQIVDLISEPWVQGNMFLSNINQWSPQNIAKGLANFIVPGAGNLLMWLAGKGLFGQKAYLWAIEGKVDEATNALVEMMEQEEQYAAERAQAEEDKLKKPRDRTSTRDRNNNNTRDIGLVGPGTGGASTSRGVGSIGGSGGGTVTVGGVINLPKDTK